jgi:disulfide bond formation protein DsbB
MRTSSATVVSVVAMLLGCAANLVSAQARAQAVPDFDGDGFADLAIGVVHDTVDGIDDVGAVNVIYGSAPGLTVTSNQRWHQSSPGILGDSEEDDAFGSSLAWGDFDDDGYTDLAIGVPQESLLFVGNAGVVHVIYGSPSGLTAAGSQVWHQDSPGIADVSEGGDRFGSVLVTGDFDGDGYTDLAISANDEDVNGDLAAGAVNVIYGSPAGLAAAGNQFWHQDSTGILDESEGGERFAQSLAAGDFDGDGNADLAIGVPGEGGASPAGAVSVIYGSGAGLTAIGDELWSQNSNGIPGINEANDDFGRSLAAGNFDGDGFTDLAIGAPLENVDGMMDAGAVYVIYGSLTGLASAGSQVWHQDSPGILNASETDDQFGGDVAAGDFNGDGRAELAISAHSEDFGSDSDVGAVNVIYGSAAGLTAAGDQLWSQDSAGILGDGQEVDQWATGFAVADFDGDGFGDLAVGGPYDRHTNSLTNSGVVNVIYGTAAGLTSSGNQLWHLDVPGILGVAASADLFGSSWTGFP